MAEGISYRAAIERMAPLLRRPEYPRTNGYDPGWVLSNLMGPNVLWLAEALSQVLEFKPGWRVLDLGCGKAISSIFLAREFGVKVWAADLWIKPTENFARIEMAGVADTVSPIYVEAHALPFAEGYFDAVVSLDAYHYFGTDDLYLGYCEKFLKPGGKLGIVVPGITAEFTGGVPEHLRPYWHKEFSSFHSPDWWAKHWTQSGHVSIDRADFVPDGWTLWRDWLEASRHLGFRHDPAEEDMLRVDDGRQLGFSRVVATREELTTAHR